MNREILLSSNHGGRDHIAADYLRQEIAFFEARLNEMGGDGDCAYEHSLSKAYQLLLKQRKSQLATLS